MIKDVKSTLHTFYLTLYTILLNLNFSTMIIFN